MGTGGLYPQIDYGQGSGAWSPAKRGEVTRQVQKATQDAAFAQNFAADIMFGKPGTGKYGSTEYWGWVPQQSGSGEMGDYKSGSSYVKTTTSDSYLYNNNTLNASKSWVAQAFGAPAVKGSDGAWYRADPRVRAHDEMAAKGGDGRYGFVAGSQITDANTVRMLNQGHYAFTAKGFDGSEVYVPWADGYTPAKGGKGAAADENAKPEQAGSGREAQMVDANTARPGNVIGGGASLLGNSSAQPDRKTLLGK